MPDFLVKLALCKGCHEFPADCDGYIFPTRVDPTDVDKIDMLASKALSHFVGGVEVYVTGLTVALVAVINVCIWKNLKLTLWHYNSSNNTYYKQEVYTCRM